MPRTVRTLLAVVASIGLSVATFSPTLAAQISSGRLPSNGACFYRDANYQGPFFCVAAGEDAPRVPQGMNDEISSIRVLGRAEVTVFQDEGFQGGSARFDGDIRNLSNEGWNDTISSIRVQGGGGGFRERFGARQQQVPRQGACFYTDADFQGQRFCLSVGETAADMPLGFNDAVSSLQVFGGASVTIFEHGNFGGQSIQVSSSIANLTSARSPNGFAWNDVISSVRVQPGGANREDRFGGGLFGGAQQTPRQGACFFTDAGFRGNRFCVASGETAAAMPLGFNDEISSIQLFGGASVVIFENENFGGQSIRIATSVPSLEDARSPNGFRWNDAISSVRVF